MIGVRALEKKPYIFYFKLRDPAVAGSLNLHFGAAEG
jgi:hypothetical protein